VDLAGTPFSLPPFSANKVWVLRGRGDGSLHAPDEYTVGLSPNGATAADVDGDGRIDLVANGAMSNTVSLLLGRSPATQGLRRAVSAASATTMVAPGSLATLYGAELASATLQAEPPWPQRLGGTAVEVRDSTGATRIAPLLYVSPPQINFQVPAGTAVGEATLTVVNDRGTSMTASMQVEGAAPGVFVVTGGLMPMPRPAAIAVRVEPDGTQTILSLWNCPSAGNCFPEPLPADGRPLYISLFATGFGGTSAARVTCSVNGQPVEVTYAGPQSIPGVDQINFRAPQTGLGIGTIVCLVGGVPTNPVWL
jgi:uncharacterized protein (TIGR03437 family)